MASFNVSPLAQALHELLEMAEICQKPQGSEQLQNRLEEVLELFRKIGGKTAEELERALQELHAKALHTNFKEATYVLLDLKERLNQTEGASIEWEPLKLPFKSGEDLEAIMQSVQTILEQDKEKRQEYAHEVEFRWLPKEVFASKSVLKRYIDLLAQAGFTLKPETITKWLSAAAKENDVIEIPTEQFEEAVRVALFDEKRAKSFEKNPPTLTFRMKTFLLDVQKIRYAAKERQAPSAHLVHAIQLKGATVSSRVDDLKKKSPEILKGINSESMACLLLGKILGFEWEINVRNPEMLGILRDVRTEMKFSTVSRELLADFDKILIKCGLPKELLVREFGLNPQDIDSIL